MTRKSRRRAIIVVVTHMNTDHSESRPESQPESSSVRAPRATRDDEPDVERELDDLAHALRSPLTALQGGLDLLNDTAREGLDDIPRRGLDLALSATRRLTTLIDDTLLLARHRAGRLELILKIEPARSIVDEALRTYRTQNPRSNLGVDIDCPDLEVVADTERVAAVICRLIALAAPANGHVQITVSRQGSAAAFELTGDATASMKRSRGTETTLSACRAVIEDHGGMFSIEPADSTYPASQGAGTGVISMPVARFTLPIPD